MRILDDRQVRQKIRRIAIEILERHCEDSELILAGINKNGYGFAGLIRQEIEQLAPDALQLTLTGIHLNPANPVEYPPYLDLSTDQVRGRSIVVIDDVANTGRTIFYAVMPLMKVVPRCVEVAVLVDREHKSWPVKADYVGLSLATTLKDNIEVRILSVEEMEVRLS
jgi:pyrimidine operon attenuation protein/uracil phosphoribosyltransferase